MESLDRDEHNYHQERGRRRDLEPDCEVHGGRMCLKGCSPIVTQAIESESGVEPDQQQAKRLPPAAMEGEAADPDRRQTRPTEVDFRSSQSSRQIRIVVQKLGVVRKMQKTCCQVQQQKCTQPLAFTVPIKSPKVGARFVLDLRDCRQTQARSEKQAASADPSTS
jgi:hypothetical protein